MIMILTLQLLKEVNKAPKLFLLLFYRDWELCYIHRPCRHADIGVMGSQLIYRGNQK